MYSPPIIWQGYIIVRFNLLPRSLLLSCHVEIYGLERDRCSTGTIREPIKNRMPGNKNKSVYSYDAYKFLIYSHSKKNTMHMAT